MADVDAGPPTPASNVRTPSAVRRAICWGVHLLTASSAVWSLLALQAAMQSEWQKALAWLLVAVLVDSIDGTLARTLDVKHVLPRFDGTLLDNIVDFASYVLVPALIIHRAQLLPDSSSLWAASGICLASAYQFCQQDAKTPDHFFKGFPSYWNIVALYLLALKLPPSVNLAITSLLIAMVFIPIKYVYVTRTTPFRAITLPLTTLWGIAALVILTQLPEPQPELVWGSLLYFVYYVLMSMYLTCTAATARPSQDTA